MLDVKVDKGIKSIDYSRIEYLKGDNKYAIVCFNNGTKLVTHEPLGWYAKILPKPHFCRCHTSYVVNCAHIYCRNGDRFVLNSDALVNISGTYKNEALETYKQFVQQSGM